MLAVIPRRLYGFTLVELMVTLAVLAIGAAIAYPSFQGVLRSNRVATATNDLIASLSLARSEAIRGSRDSGVCPSSDGTECEGNWEAGVMVWARTAPNTIETVRYTKPGRQLVISGPEDGIEFDSRGRRGSARDRIDLQPADCESGTYRRGIHIGVTGQVRLEKLECQ